MSITLNMGVLDIPYTDTNSKTTTGEVAEILEKKYRVMEGFYELNAQEISDNIAVSLNNALESVALGANPLNINPFAEATSKIETRFKQFLEREELAKLGRSGVPTLAAMKGYSSRLKKRRGSPRPSFIDTGLYEQTFKAWIKI